MKRSPCTLRPQVAQRENQTTDFGDRTASMAKLAAAAPPILSTFTYHHAGLTHIWLYRPAAA